MVYMFVLRQAFRPTYYLGGGVFWRKIIGFSSPKIGSNLPKLEGNREFTSQNYDFANHNIYGFNQAE